MKQVMKLQRFNEREKKKERLLKYVSSEIYHSDSTMTPDPLETRLGEDT